MKAKKRFLSSKSQGKKSLRAVSEERAGFTRMKPKVKVMKAPQIKSQSTSNAAEDRVRVSPAIRTCAKQTHIRFRFNDIEVVPINVARESLIAASVKPQSLNQYDSRLRTLARFLQAIRHGASNDVMSCTKEEFFNFLHNWKLQKKGSPEAVRSALLKQHDIHGIIPSYLRDKDTVLAVKGAGRDCPHVDKAILDPEQRNVFLDAILHAPEEALGRCNLCTSAGRDADFRLRLQIEAEFLWEVPIRLTDAGKLKINDFKGHGRPRCVFVEGLKTSPNGGDVIVNEDGWELFESATALTKNNWLFPKCGTHHLGALVQWCQAEYEWEPNLVWVAYSMRHTGMNKREKKVADAVSELIHNVTRPVSRRYARDNSQRRKRGSSN